MQRLLTRKIKMPRLEVNVDDTAQEEKLVRARDHVLRTAIPTLDDYILQPFSGALKEEVFARARREHGINRQGLLKGSAKKDYEFDAVAFAVSAGPALSTSYEQVIDDLRSILRQAKGRMSQGIRHVNVSALRTGLIDAMEENSTGYNRLEARLASAPERELNEFVVKLDKGHYAVASQKNALDFVDARTLRKDLLAFTSAVETELQTKYAVKDAAEINQELADESAVRYLFFPKTTTEYSEVVKGLVGQTTGKPSSSNGDLDILDQLAFKGTYEYARGKLTVATESNHGAGKTRITRHLASGEDVREYHVVKHMGVHVAIEDVQKTLSALLTAKSTTATQLKVDFFPAYKGY